MKKIGYIIFGIFLISCASNVNKKSDKKIVKSVLNQFITAVQDKDYSKLDQLTQDDFVIYENGLVWSFEEFSSELEDYDSVKINYELSNLHLIIDNTTAHAQFMNRGTFEYPDTTIVLNFIESATFIKDDDNWQIKFYHSTHSK